VNANPDAGPCTKSSLYDDVKSTVKGLKELKDIGSDPEAL